MVVNKEKFQEYERIRQEGSVNMFNVPAVIELSDGLLDKEDIIDIMRNYKKYKKEFGA